MSATTASAGATPPALEALQAQLKELMSDPTALEFDLPLDNGQLAPVKEAFRTPDECFSNLPDFAFEPHYFQSQSHGSLRIHYLDEGPRDAEQTIFLMHGMPCWSYVYRHMIPPLAAAGYRVVVPDLIGFGRSDKPTARSDHSFERHVDWLAEFVVGLRLDNITAFLHDWGGMAMLRVIARLPERFLRVCLGGTGLLTGSGMSANFKAWAGGISQKIPEWGPFIDACSADSLSTAEQAAYDAPFPSEEYKAMRMLPQLVAVLPEHPSVEENTGAWRRVYERWNKPFLTIWGDEDKEGNDGGSAKWKSLVPGAASQRHHLLKKKSHFVQEGNSEEIVEHLLRFIDENPMPINCATIIR